MTNPYVKYNNPQNRLELEWAISEAEDRLLDIEDEIENFRREAQFWIERVDRLWEQWYANEPKTPEHPVGPGQTSIELNNDFFEKD